VGGLGGDVEVDAGPEQGVGAGEAGAGTLGFAKHIIRREAGEGNLRERFLLIVEDAVVELEELLRGRGSIARSFTDSIIVSAAYSSRPGCFPDMYRVTDERAAFLR
jgi:hypothetical protein